MKICEILKTIREFFWPMLDPLEPNSIQDIKLDDCSLSRSEIQFELKCMEEYKKSEDDRRKDVEGKATIFIGTFAVATTVLINLAKEFIFNSNTTVIFFKNIVIILISLTIIYLCKAIQFSIKTLERRNYRTLGFPKFMFTDEDNKELKVLVMQYNAIKKNQEEINIKVDYMTMAQEFFKRAVNTVFVLTFMFLSSHFILTKDLMPYIRDTIKKITFNEWGNIAILLIFLAAIIVLFIKINKLEKQSNV